MRRARRRTGRSTSSGPYNDLRFAKNRPPYKTHQGAFCESDGGAGHYVHLGADGLLAGVGYYSMAKDQLERFRAAVDADATGAEVARDRRRRSAAQGYSIGAMDELKTAPRGYPKDHPRIELLRRKGLMASRQCPVAGVDAHASRRSPRCARRGPARRRCAPGSTPTSARARCRPTDALGALSGPVGDREPRRLTECQA